MSITSTAGTGATGSAGRCTAGTAAVASVGSVVLEVAPANGAGAVGAASCQSGVCDPTTGGAGTCEPALSCGNALLESSESCDDGNIAPGDGCDALCKIEDGNRCGVGLGAVGDSSCQSGICNTAGGVPGVCAPSQTCGNNVVELGEGCDDGARAPGDGCDASCKIENGTACGTMISGLLGSASCQSGICDTAGNAAPGVCEANATCGNSPLEANEGCDDGNLLGNDGCNPTCLTNSMRAATNLRQGYSPTPRV